MIFQVDNEQEKDDIRERLKQNYVINGVVNGTGKVKVDKFGNYCKKAMLFRKRKWKWSHIPNAIHETYSHIPAHFKKYGGYANGHRSEVKSCILCLSFVQGVLHSVKKQEIYSHKNIS